MDTRRRSPRDRLTTLHRAILRRRRPLAAACTAIATFAALRAVAPPAAETVSVQVAATDLPAGHVLTGGDLETRSVAPDHRPDGLVTDPVGATLAAPLRAGEPVTDVRLVGPDLTLAQPDGAVALPVRLSDAGQAALLDVGDHIDLFATDPQDQETDEIADDAIVLALPAADENVGPAASGGRVVVLALPAVVVEEVTAAAVARFVTFAWADD